MIHSLLGRQAISKYLKRLSCCLILTCLLSNEVYSQQFFNDITNGSNVIHSFDAEYGGGASFVDFDDDGWDDLTVCDNDGIKFFKNDSGQFSLITPPVNLESAYKQVTWVDFDNDGDKDLFCSGEYVPFRLFERIADFTFEEITVESGLPSTNARTNGHSWGDYNKDGLLDLFICNYDHQSYSNWIFKNNGDGTFTDKTVELGFDEELEFSFQSVFLDYNNDGWQDLLVINDKTFHPNRLYKNEYGTFVDVTIASGLHYQVNAMSNTVADYNNDGLQDIFISDANNNLLHKNNGDGTFEEIAQSAGLSNIGFTWGGLFVDVDNNALLDLIICSSKEIAQSGRNRLFMNDGDDSFTLNNISGLGNQLTDSYCPISGDIDNDGFSDVFITGGNEDLSVVMKNLGNGGNYLKLTLEGVISNRDGIGSRIELWTDSVKQTKYTLCGEGYLGQNSNNMIFGLGSATTVDSLKVTWLSGVIDKIYNLPPNQDIEIVEGQSLSNQIVVDGELSLCDGDSTLLIAGDFESFLWNTGDTTSSISVSSNGDFSVAVIDSFGFEIHSDTVNIAHHPNPLISPTVEHVSCFGNDDGAISLQNLSGSPVDTCIWNNEISGTAIDSLPPGQYNYEFIDIYGCSASGTLSIAEPYPLKLTANTTNQVGDEAGSAEVFINGGTSPYSVYWSNGAENTLLQDSLEAGFYGVWVVDTNGCKEYEILFIDFIQSLASPDAEKVKAYPNPVSSNLKIENLPLGTRLVEVTNVDGRSLISKVATTKRSSLTVDLNNLSSGVYFLKIYHQTGIFTKQIIKH
ncbi:FG-GAP-like repeat-containing protein [Halocola ammonii]